MWCLRLPETSILFYMALSCTASCGQKCNSATSHSVDSIRSFSIKFTINLDFL